MAILTATLVVIILYTSPVLSVCHWGLSWPVIACLLCLSGACPRAFKFSLTGNSPTPSQVRMLIQTSRDVLHPVMEVGLTFHFPVQKLPPPPTLVTDPRVVESVVRLAPMEQPH